MKKVYWDTSAIVMALEDEHVRKYMEAHHSWTRTHTLAELFSTLTGGRLPYQCSPDQAWDLIENVSQPITLFDIDTTEVKEYMAQAGNFGVRGGRVHDYLHARAAQHCQADELLTLNTSDFEGLCDAVKIVTPTGGIGSG